MEKLKQNDGIVNPTAEQALKIFKASNLKAVGLDKQTFINDCIVRGGIFWSERYNRPFAGNLSSGNKLQFKDFLSRIQPTIN